MTKTQKTILFTVLGSIVMVVIAVVVVAVWAFRSMVDNTSMDGTSAAKVMEDVRARFQHAEPVLDIRPGSLTLSRRPPDTKAAGELKTLHVLRWDIHEERLSRLEVPFWLLRLSDDPIDVIFEDQPNESGLKVRTPSSVTVEEIERFGPVLLVDGQMPDGGHLMVWSD